MKIKLQNMAGDPFSFGNIKDELFTKLKRYSAPIIGLLFLSIIMTILSPFFLTAENLMNILRQISTNGMLAMAMTFVILTGGIDLSVGSIMALSGTLAAGLISRTGVHVLPAVVIALLAGFFFGAFNGFLISSTTMAPFIVTLATMNIVRGLGYIYTGGLPVGAVEESYNKLGLGYIGPLPNPVFFLILFYLVFNFILKRTTFGRHVYAIGDSNEAAYFAGIKVKKIQFSVYSLSGLITSFAGILLSARMYSGQPTAGQGFELDAVAACVLGGISMSGGVGSLAGTMLGTMIIGVLNNGLNLLNINSFWQLFVKGLVIIIAVYMDDMKNSKN